MSRALRIQSRAEEEREVVYAPFLMAIGLILTSVLVTVWPAWSPLGALIMVAALVLWVRESITYGPDLTTLHPEYHDTGDRFHRPSHYWWASLVYSIIFTAGLFAALRVAQAHDLLDPSAGPLALRPSLGHGTAAVALVGLIGATVAARTARRGTHVAASLALLALAPAIMLTLVITQATLIMTNPVVDDTAPRLAALLWTQVFQAVWLTAALLFLGLVALRAALGHVPHEPWNIGSAAILFAAVAMAQAIIAWAVLQLRLVTLESNLLG